MYTTLCPLLLVLCFLGNTFGGYTQIKVYPQFVAQGGRVHFEDDRWDGHNGLDVQHLIDECKSIGTESGRWLNRDIDIFPHVPQDPHHHGYPDPNHFTNNHGLCNKYVQNINGYHLFSGSNSDMIMEIKGLNWPSWIDKGHHGGKFPNNIDAAAQFSVLLLDAIKKCSHGSLPAYFEVMNEPDASWKYINWDTIIQYHKTVASKLKAKFPGMWIGGPTKTGYMSSSNEHGFREWSNSEQFLNMSLDHMDFFSFHPYNDFTVTGNSYRWSGANEARLVAYMDMLENYADIRKGRAVPLIISEYGLGDVSGIDDHRPSDFIDWAFINQHHAHLFTYQQGFRFAIDRAVGFLLANEEYLGEFSLHYSLFNHDGSERHPGKAYRFWHHLNYGFKYLRVESKYDNHDRLISPLALIHPNQKKVSVLLHNYEFHDTTVNLQFMNHFVTNSNPISHCFYLGSNKSPVLAENVPVHMNNNNVYMRPDSSCIFEFHIDHVPNIPTIDESTHYADQMKIPVKRQCGICIVSCQGCEYAVKTHVNVGDTSNMQYAMLRVGVTIDGNNGNPDPTGVKVNGHTVSSYYRMFMSGRWHEGSRWEVYVYSVPTSYVKHGSNEVKIAFHQESGYVSTAALIVGNL